MQGNLRSIQRVSVSTQYSPTRPADMTQLTAVGGLLIILLPIIVTCTIAGYRKHQAIVRQQQVQRLNRLWQLNSSKPLS